MLNRLSLNRGALFGWILVTALVAFEGFNFGTNEFSFHSIFGETKIWGIRWSIILAIAFSGMDFGGIARIFTPEEGTDEPAGVWFLFGAWLLAALFNAILTWWGLSVAIATNNHVASIPPGFAASFVTNGVPIFIAGMVFLVRLLIIGTFSKAGERLFTTTVRAQR